MNESSGQAFPTMACEALHNSNNMSLSPFVVVEMLCRLIAI
jgi:hypothetical protein